MPETFRKAGRLKEIKKKKEIRVCLKLILEKYSPLPLCAFSTVLEETKVMTAQGLHLFPFRTEKLNLATPMVLRKRESR